MTEVDQELGGGELSISACPGVRNRPPRKSRKKQIANPQGYTWGTWLQVKLNHA